MSEPVMERETVKEWLDSLAARTASYGSDDIRMQNFLHMIGITNAICVYGIVYMEGKGTVNAPPVDIHTVARWVIIKYNKAEEA